MGLKKQFLVVTIASMTLLAACGASTAASSTTTTTAAKNVLTLEDGGTVTVAISRFPSEFNPSTPAGANATTEMVMAQVWPQAFVVDSHADAELSPPVGLSGVIDSAEVTSVSPETIVYDIDPKAVWSDGVPITAADFIYNWQEALVVGPSMSSTFPLAGYQAIASVTSSNGGKTATVTFAKPYADWEDLFSNLIPAHIGKKGGWAAAFGHYSSTDFVSGGPFIITKMVAGREIVLSRNPKWWGTPAHLAHIVFLVEPTEAATLEGLSRGTVDLALTEPGEALNRVLDSHLDLIATTSSSPLLWQLTFNVANPTLSSLPLREAIAQAIDRQELLASTVGLLAQNESVAENRLYFSGAPESQGNAGGYAQVDISHADALLSEAGYTLGSNGYVLDAARHRLSLTLVGPSGSSNVVAIEQEIRAQLLQAGVLVRIKNVPMNELLGKELPAGTYEMALAPYSLSAFPSTAGALYTPSTSLSTATPTGNPLVGSDPDASEAGSVTGDVMGFSNSDVTSLFNEASVQLNASAQAGLYNEIDTMLWAEVPTLPLFQMPTALVANDAIVNVTDADSLQGPLWDAELWAIQLSPPPTTSTIAGAS